MSREDRRQHDLDRGKAALEAWQSGVTWKAAGALIGTKPDRAKDLAFKYQCHANGPAMQKQYETICERGSISRDNEETNEWANE